MSQVNTFSLGAIPAITPTLPPPLPKDQYNTRQDIKDHRNATESYYAHHRHLKHLEALEADRALAREKAEANREMSDAEYDEQGLKRFNDQRDKAAAAIAKQKQDELNQIAFRLSSPPIVEIFKRSEFALIKELEYWFGLGYTLEDDGLTLFQPSFYQMKLTAPKAKGKK